MRVSAYIVLAFLSLVVGPALFLLAQGAYLRFGVPIPVGVGVCAVFLWGLVDLTVQLDRVVRLNLATEKEQKEFLRRAG